VSRIKVLEVAAASDAEACAQAAAIRDGLDPARFDATFVDADAHVKLRRLFAEQKPDVVHAHGPKAGAAARSAAKSAGVAKIFYSPRGYRFLRTNRSAAARAMDWAFEKASAKIGAVIAVSTAEAEAARRLGAKHVSVVFDAHLGGFPEPKAHDGLVVGSLGEMTRAQDPDAWVLLAQRLCDSRNGLSCLWIGGGEDEAKARTDLTNMNLLMKVEVTGAIPADAARERLRGLDLFVRYARAGSPSGQLLDAMACGLPVVASDLPAHRDLVEDGVTGYLVKNEVELLERCQALLDDDALRARLGAAGRERVRSVFSREKTLAELSHLYSGNVE
jgi:glycosyltransferase involved in cell wall biosynthesis